MPRTKTIAALLLVFAFATVVHAQTTDTKEPAKTIASKKTTAPSAEPEVALKERRARARSLLIALSSDARSFHDQMLRARSLARIADALWRVDAEQGRLLFRKAWDAAEVADQESDRKLQEEINQQRSKTGGGYAVNLPPNVRREVLRLAARHDRVLGEEFLEKLKAQKVDTSATSLNPNRLSDSMSQRLSLALELFRNGDMERALQFADPALAIVSRESLNFLTYLREKDPAAADARYSAMLGNAASNPQSDANTVSLLSSYIFTPRLYMVFTGHGVSTSQMSSTFKPAEVSPELRSAFFQTASGILLRPLPPPGQEQIPNSPGIDGKFLVIKRLLPFFEQSAPAEMVESLRGHLSALNEVACAHIAFAHEKRSELNIDRVALGGSLRPIESVQQRLLAIGCGFIRLDAFVQKFVVALARAF